jgi:L-cysteine:1D-myo-inositol 2-amino-2-deoxy-alpha-D-glucopyranoside ligase
MRLYNSSTRTIDELSPRDGRVSIYVCGITPYDVTHLGHAFTYLTFDVIRRYLEWQGVQVHHVQNITDVDDDIIRKARELDTTPEELTERNVAWFDDDMRALGALRPHVFPRVSEEIDTIQEIVARLLRADHAYEANGDVYFDVRTFPSYGTLSGLSPAEMLAENERQRMRRGPRNPLDFLLWQAEAPGEPSWESPWGRGRPGWHIECTAMAVRHAGATLDIHGGGRDLIFPHHESEIAQSESFTGQSPFVRTWAHVGMIRYQGEKMSKSLGNLVLVKNLLQSHTPDAIRLSLLNIHYLDSYEWTEGGLAEADGQAERLLLAAGREPGSGEAIDPTPLVVEFRAALDDNLDTPRAVRALSALGDRINGARGLSLISAQEALRECGGILGLRLMRSGE